MSRLSSVARSVIVTLSVALAACSTSVLPGDPSGQAIPLPADSVALRLGTDVHVGGVWLTLSSVPNDSRCPQSTQCVWAGDAVAAITVNPGCWKAGCAAPATQLALHTGVDPKAGDALGHHITLLGLAPAPTKTGGPPAYVAWVRVTQ